MNEILQNIIGAPLTWFKTILDETGTFVLFISAIGSFLLVRFLILPLIGGQSGSDSAKSKKGNKKK